MNLAFEPRDPDFEKRVRESFARQGLLATFAAELRSVEPGAVDIEVPFAPGLTQQDDFFHAGVTIAALDSACGYAALTLMEPGVRVLTVELKVNLLAPAIGDSLQVHGEVIRPGRNLTVCRGDAYALSGDGSKHVATMLATMTGIAELNVG
ncbi:MAG: PaaI family thioesterase [Mycobacterium sp.]